MSMRGIVEKLDRLHFLARARMMDAAQSHVEHWPEEQDRVVQRQSDEAQNALLVEFLQHWPVIAAELNTVMGRRVQSNAGRVRWQRTEHITSCICCKGPHVYMRTIDGLDYMEWVRDAVAELPEGAMVRLVIEFHDGP